MKQLIFLTLYVFMFWPASSQGHFQTVIDSIIVNNKTLAAGRQLTDMLKISSKTGLYLPNPSVSFDRLTSTAAGNYTEMIISQSFDFPTAYVYKKKISDLYSSQAEEQFRQSKLEILKMAAQVYSELIYSNRKISILSERLKMAVNLKDGIEKRLKTGDADIFETNRIRSELAFVRSELQLSENNRITLSMKLSGLNGGIKIAVNDTIFPELSEFILTDTSINQIVNRNPQIKQWITEQEIAQKSIGLQKSLTLPKFEIGYRQDLNTGQTYNGIHAGISIPLFENKNMVKTAKARQMYAIEASSAYKLELQSKVSQLIEEYKAMQQSAISINEVFKTLNTPDLLVKAYKAGQINYTEFFTQYENYQQTALYAEDLNQKAAALQLQLYVLSGL